MLYKHSLAGSVDNLRQFNCVYSTLATLGWETVVNWSWSK